MLVLRVHGELVFGMPAAQAISVKLAVISSMIRAEEQHCLTVMYRSKLEPAGKVMLDHQPFLFCFWPRF
jgi:hypothetical protein